MKLTVRILNYSVLRDCVSVKFVWGETVPEGRISDLKNLKGNTQQVRIGDLSTTGAVKSVAFGKGVHILFSCPRNRYVVNRLFDLMDGDATTIFLYSERERRLLCLLNAAAKTLRKPVEDLLYELTTFRGREGKMVDGKRSIYDLSPKFQDVLIKKLLGQADAAPQMKAGHV